MPALSPEQLILFEQQYDGLVKKGLAENPYTEAKTPEGGTKNGENPNRLPPIIF